MNIAFSSVTIGTNRSVSSYQRASVNGLALLGGTVARVLAPATAGFLVTYCLCGMIVPGIGVYILYGFIAGFGLVALTYMSTVMKQYYNKDGSLDVPKD